MLSVPTMENFMPAFGSVPSVPSTGNHRSEQLSDDIEFEIKGAEMQFAEIELDPGESVVAEAGALMFKDASTEPSARAACSAR
jgi:hypothetical protein